MAPDHGPMITPGMNWQNPASPTHAALSVVLYSTYGTVTVWIQVPMFETRAPVQKIAKLRCLSAATAAPRAGRVAATEAIRAI